VSIVNVVWYDMICFKHVFSVYVNEIFIRNANDVNTSILVNHQPRAMKSVIFFENVDRTYHAF